jgi:hypothetical protein
MVVNDTKVLFRLGITQRPGSQSGVFEYQNRTIFANSDEDDVDVPEFTRPTFISFEQNGTGLHDVFLPDIDQRTEYIISTDVNDNEDYRVKAKGFTDINGIFFSFTILNGIDSRWRYGPESESWWKVG